MAKQDLRINEFGINVADIAAGQWVNLHFDDTHEDEVFTGLVVEVEVRSPGYKGERNLQVLYQEDAGGQWEVMPYTVLHTQVKEILGWLNPLPLTTK